MELCYPSFSLSLSPQFPPLLTTFPHTCYYIQILDRHLISCLSDFSGRNEWQMSFHLYFWLKSGTLQMHRQLPSPISVGVAEGNSWKDDAVIVIHFHVDSLGVWPQLLHLVHHKVKKGAEWCHQHQGPYHPETQYLIMHRGSLLAHITLKHNTSSCTEAPCCIQYTFIRKLSGIITGLWITSVFLWLLWYYTETLVQILLTMRHEWIMFVVVTCALGRQLVMWCIWGHEGWYLGCSHRTMCPTQES